MNDSQILLAESVSRSQTRIAKNKANKSLYKLAEEIPDNGIVRLFKGKKAPAREEIISVMIDGVKKDMLIRGDLAKEWVTTDPILNQNAANYLGWISGAKILRPMATGLNPAFAITNFPRDLAHTYLVTQVYSPHAPKFIAQMSKDLSVTMKDVFLRKGRYKDYINEGGGMEFLTHQG